MFISPVSFSSKQNTPGSPLGRHLRKALTDRANRPPEVTAPFRPITGLGLGRFVNGGINIGECIQVKVLRILSTGTTWQATFPSTLTPLVVKKAARKTNHSETGIVQPIKIVNESNDIKTIEITGNPATQLQLGPDIAISFSEVVPNAVGISPTGFQAKFFIDAPAQKVLRDELVNR